MAGFAGQDESNTRSAIHPSHLTKQAGTWSPGQWYTVPRASSRFDRGYRQGGGKSGMNLLIPRIVSLMIFLRAPETSN